MDVISSEYVYFSTDENILLTLNKTESSDTSLIFHNVLKRATDMIYRTMNTMHYIKGVCLYSTVSDGFHVAVGEQRYMNSEYFRKLIKEPDDPYCSLVNIGSDTLLCYTVFQNSKPCGYLIFSIDIPQIIGSSWEDDIALDYDIFTELAQKD